METLPTLATAIGIIALGVWEAIKMSKRREQNKTYKKFPDTVLERLSETIETSKSVATQTKTIGEDVKEIKDRQQTHGEDLATFGKAIEILEGNDKELFRRANDNTAGLAEVKGRLKQ